jgi:pyruvate kinase
MKHGDVKWHSKEMVRLERVSKELGKRVATLIDLQGPEVRVAMVPANPFVIRPGDRFWLVKPKSARVGVVLDHPQVLTALREGKMIFADDGFLAFQVIKVDAGEAEVEVVEGGELKERKTMNFPGVALDFPCMVDKDVELLSLAARHTVDYVGLSFVRSVRDINDLRAEMERLGVQCGVIAKIEHPQAVDHFEEILAASDGVMVARGDLGIEYPIEQVPSLQKMIVGRCIDEGKSVIVATQMLESMHTQPRPTRAEVSDVATAVYDLTDAVMLSGETAIGKYPVKAVKIMASICQTTEPAARQTMVKRVIKPGTQEEAMVAAAYQLSQTYAHKQRSIRAFVVLTETGQTARYLARLRPEKPILALSSDKKTLDRLQLVWGVQPVFYDYAKDEETETRAVLLQLREQEWLKRGDQVVVVYGERWGKPGETSVVRVQEVG